MAKYERKILAGFDEVLQLCNTAIMDGSTSASYEDGSDYTINEVSVAIRIYERYSWFGGNRVSLSLTLIGNDEQVYLTAITSGGSQAVFYKINTIGEEEFLKTLVSEIEKNFPNNSTVPASGK